MGDHSISIICTRGIVFFVYAAPDLPLPYLYAHLIRGLDRLYRPYHRHMSVLKRRVQRV
jgi:hypothetical protein